MYQETLTWRAERPEPTQRSIFDYYDIRNEVAFIRDRAHLSDAQHDFYVQQNVHKFLGEFAGQLPYTKLSFGLTNEGLNFAGINLRSSYERAAAIAGPGSREADELIAYDKTVEEFQKGARALIHISPPKTWDYSFCFVYINEGYDPQLGQDKITLYPLRFGEPQNSTERSEHVANQLGLPIPGTSTRDFVRNPVGIHTDNPQEVLAQALAAVGIGETEIQRSLLFEKEVNVHLADYITSYAQAILDLRQQAELGEASLIEAKMLLNTIYNYAEALRGDAEAREASAYIFAPPEDWRRMDERARLAHFANRRATTSGGSCPTTKEKNRGQFQSYTDSVEQLLKGKTLGETASDEDAEDQFECPKCHMFSTPPVGDQCPKCNITLAQWIEESKENGFAVCG